MSENSSDLVDIWDEFSLSGHVDLLVVGSHLTLDGEEKNLQVSLLCEPEETRDTRVEKDREKEGGSKKRSKLDDWEEVTNMRITM